MAPDATLLDVLAEYSQQERLLWITTLDGAEFCGSVQRVFDGWLMLEDGTLVSLNGVAHLRIEEEDDTITTNNNGLQGSKEK